MGLSRTERDFEKLKKTKFIAGETPYQMWQAPSVESTETEVDIIEQFRFNVQNLEELSSRFQFVLEELSSVLIKRES